MRTPTKINRAAQALLRGLYHSLLSLSVRLCCIPSGNGRQGSRHGRSDLLLWSPYPGSAELWGGAPRGFVCNEHRRVRPVVGHVGVIATLLWAGVYLVWPHACAMRSLYPPPHPRQVRAVARVLSSSLVVRHAARVRPANGVSLRNSSSSCDTCVTPVNTRPRHIYRSVRRRVGSKRPCAVPAPGTGLCRTMCEVVDIGKHAHHRSDQAHFSARHSAAAP